MGNIFAGSEIVAIGVEIEKNGRDFYNAVSAQAKDKKAKEIFGYLAGEEEKHIAVFQKLLDSVNKYEPPEAYPGEYFAYMSALAGEHVFTRKNTGRDTARQAKTDSQAVNMGIGFEKDSLVFYEGMKKAVPDYDRAIVEELILEEQGHLRKLSAVKKELSV